MSKMNRERGFTLIELLVVIAIIAVLMGILMPALSRVRKQAKAVVCQTSLKQWGTIFVLYTEDNDTKFPTRTQSSGRWINVLFDYYHKDERFRCCPMATKPTAPQGASGTLAVGGSATLAWGKLLDTGGRPIDTYGSYGINHWVYKAGQDPLYGQAAKDYWGTINVRNVSQIPLFLDCWFWCGGPENDDLPPQTEGERRTGHIDSMQRFAIDRHQGAINAIYLDQTARKIPLKSLWRQRWHRSWSMTYPLPDWPDWMMSFPDP